MGAIVECFEVRFKADLILPVNDGTSLLKASVDCFYSICTIFAFVSTFEFSRGLILYFSFDIKFCEDLCCSMGEGALGVCSVIVAAL